MECLNNLEVHKSSATFSTYLFYFILLCAANKSYFLSQLLIQFILCQVFAADVSCAIPSFFECRFRLERLNFFKCKWSFCNCTQRKGKKEPRWKFFFFLNFHPLWKFGRARPMRLLYVFVSYSWGSVIMTRGGSGISKTCEHIFMLIALCSSSFHKKEWLLWLMVIVHEKYVLLKWRKYTQTFFCC